MRNVTLGIELVIVMTGVLSVECTPRYSDVLTHKSRCVPAVCYAPTTSCIDTIATSFSHIGSEFHN